MALKTEQEIADAVLALAKGQGVRWMTIQTRISALCAESERPTSRPTFLTRAEHGLRAVRESMGLTEERDMLMSKVKDMSDYRRLVVGDKGSAA